MFLRKRKGKTGSELFCKIREIEEFCGEKEGNRMKEGRKEGRKGGREG